ncbi:hypothetical protein V6Z11_D08G120100 [Gossypium hirsutum]
MMAWDRMCHPQGMGGIGFRDLHLFNLALLGRQVWRLLHFIDTLCFKVLSAKNFPDGDVFRPKDCDKPSYTWSSITKAAEALQEGFVWLVGDGKTIDIRRDNWGFESLNGDSICQSLLTNNERKAQDLWDHDRMNWNRDEVIELYGNLLGDQICNLPICTMVLLTEGRGVIILMVFTVQVGLFLAFPQEDRVWSSQSILENHLETKKCFLRFGFSAGGSVIIFFQLMITSLGFVRTVLKSALGARTERRR